MVSRAAFLPAASFFRCSASAAFFAAFAAAFASFSAATFAAAAALNGNDQMMTAATAKLETSTTHRNIGFINRFVCALCMRCCLHRWPSCCRNPSRPNVYLQMRLQSIVLGVYCCLLRVTAHGVGVLLLQASIPRRDALRMQEKCLCCVRLTQISNFNPKLIQCLLEGACFAA